MNSKRLMLVSLLFCNILSGKAQLEELKALKSIKTPILTVEERASA
jgi:hypothetical protein